MLNPVGAVSIVQASGSSFRPRGPLRSRSSLVYFSVAVYLAAAYQFIHYYVTFPFFYLRLPEYFSGRERLPFQLRVLPILIMEPLGRSRLLQHIAAIRGGPLHNPDRFAFLILSLTAFAVACLYLVRLYRAVSTHRRMQFLLFPTFFFIVIWTYVLHVEQNMSFPYDLPSLAFFTAGIFYIYRRQFLPLAIILFVGTLNRETTLFLIGIYMLDAASVDLGTATASLRTRFDLSRVPWLRVALLCTLWLSAKIPLAIHFRWNDHNEDINRIPENFLRLITPWQWPAALNLGGYLLPFVVIFRARLRPTRFANYLYILVPWVAVMFCTGIILETRVYGELCGYLAVAVVLLIERYVEDLITAGNSSAATLPDEHLGASGDTSPAPLAKPAPALHR